MLSSSDRDGEFCHFFRMPLSKVEELTTKLVLRGCVREPRTHWRKQEFRDRAELLVMSALYILAHGASFRSLRPLCHISKSECTIFFHVFIDEMNNMRDEFISMPKNASELAPITRGYEKSGLPGCCGSMDVVHVRWSQCPTGDLNRAKGKESYPTLAFECVTDFNRQILGVYGPHFGSRNDKEIVKSDPTVEEVTMGWLSKVFWKYYAVSGIVKISKGMYLICDNGYLRWPTSICPYSQAVQGSAEGYFSSNLESVRKDVECTFGIMKKRWRILHNGFHYRDISKCQKIFVTCCCLHNFLIDMMEGGKVHRCHRVGPLNANDGMWLAGPTPDNPVDSGRSLEHRFCSRRSILSKHLRVFKQRGGIE